MKHKVINTTLIEDKTLEEVTIRWTEENKPYNPSNNYRHLEVITIQGDDFIAISSGYNDSVRIRPEAIPNLIKGLYKMWKWYYKK